MGFAKTASIAAMICWLATSPGAAQPVTERPDPSTVIAGDSSTDDAAQVIDTPAPAIPAQDIALQTFIRTLRPKAIERGVSGSLFDATVPTLTYNDRVIRLDRAQPGASSSSSASPDFAPYLASHVDANRINMGRSRYGRLRPLLAGIETKTGVPEQIMLAIYGHETGYGTFTGNFDLLRSLATLAFEGRRRELFTAEFIDTLLLLQRGFPRETLKGSWAGATGYPQFLPSVYLRLGIDGDNDGRVDIWRSEPDALASIGNYLSDAGWKPGTPWGVAVRVPDGFDRGAVSSVMSSPRCPRVHARHSRWLTVAEWRQKGLMMLGSRVPADDELTMLIEPDGPGRTAYLMTTNYRSILDYNCSNYYALSVGLLGDAVGN